MRHEIEWVTAPPLWDLAQADPLHLLPILFSVTIYFSSQSGAKADPNQAVMIAKEDYAVPWFFW